MRYQVPVLATLCGWGSILCLKHLAKSTQVLVGAICKAHILVSTPAPVWKKKSFDFLLHHLKLRLSVWLGKAELLSLHSLSLCKAGKVLPGSSLSNTLRMGKHTVLEIFGKKHSSPGAVLKKAQLGIICGQKANHYKLLFGSRISRHPITSHHDVTYVTMKAPVWRKNSSSTSC